MPEVSIVGLGTTPFGELDAGVKELGVTSVVDALNSTAVSREDVDALYVGNYVSGMLEGQETIAPLIADNVGMNGVPVMKTEGACASSGIAFNRAYRDIATGLHDVVVVTGVESMTGADQGQVTRAISSGRDGSTEGKTGLTFPGFYGLIMDRYMHEYGATREEIAHVSVKNRRNGLNNPRAQLGQTLTVEDVVNSPPVAAPLHLHDCCPVSDGSATVILSRADRAHEFTDTPVDVLASAHTSGRSAAYRYDDLTTMDATVRAADEAYDMASITPADVDVVELHDCFSLAEIGDSEDLGFFEKGQGIEAVTDGRTAVDGELPINPSGGLLAKGHPVGATGIGQIYEICLQLRDQHENQIEGADIGLTHNLGGSGAVCTVTVLGSGAHA